MILTFDSIILLQNLKLSVKFSTNVCCIGIHKCIIIRRQQRAIEVERWRFIYCQWVE